MSGRPHDIRLRILADDLTGALDCAAAFGAGVPVHLGRPPALDPAGIDIVATATRDVPVDALSSRLTPSLPWLRGADIAFKKVDSLLRGNTFDEVDAVARQGRFQGLAFVPAFPAQGRFTEGGRQWWARPDGSRTAVSGSIREAMQARGWRIESGAHPPVLAQDAPVAWVPDIVHDANLDQVAAFAQRGAGPWLWCGSAGLAHALAHPLAGGQAARTDTGAATGDVPILPHEEGGPVMLVSASHHPVSREQWRVMRASPQARHCESGEDPSLLAREAAQGPRLIDLSAAQPLTPHQAAALLEVQAQGLARHARRPRVLVVVGGDTLLALCRALGTSGMTSAVPLDRPGWGCARMRGGRWDGLVCHTRSGAFGGPRDLLEVVEGL